MSIGNDLDEVMVCIPFALELSVFRVSTACAGPGGGGRGPGLPLTLSLQAEVNPSPATRQLCHLSELLLCFSPYHGPNARPA